MFGRAKKCVTCEELQKQVSYLQGLVDRLMIERWPKIDPDKPEPPVEAIDDKSTERITFGEG